VERTDDDQYAGDHVERVHAVLPFLLLPRLILGAAADAPRYARRRPPRPRRAVAEPALASAWPRRRGRHARAPVAPLPCGAVRPCAGPLAPARRRHPMSKLASFDDLIQTEVQDLYSAEQQFLEALPSVAEAISDDELRDAIEQHATVTQRQIERLEEIARLLGVTLDGEKCIAAEALIEEGRKLMQAGGDPMVLDAALIGAAQRMEHYEIAGYGTLAALANRIGNSAAARLAAETLAEERGADELLTEIAERSVNDAAAS